MSPAWSLDARSDANYVPFSGFPANSAPVPLAMGLGTVAPTGSPCLGHWRRRAAKRCYTVGNTRVTTQSARCFIHGPRGGAPRACGGATVADNRQAESIINDSTKAFEAYAVGWFLG